MLIEREQSREPEHNPHSGNSDARKYQLTDTGDYETYSRH